MIITSLTIAPPETGADCMPRQSRHFSNLATCRFSNSCRFVLAIAPTIMRVRRILALVFNEAYPSNDGKLRGKKVPLVRMTSMTIGR
jgi:hypothetical protein